ncbi:asparaginase [Streptomyces abyssalis]|uniref:Asparaginase n=1 Tax=Streptomyces abyssalis TaxID=933944 RepID=A0A1E7JNZ2_9ACTN|nr:asparaginase [Streptomyces abyssalis]OEU86648.1 asparaginase [Streptomyces abyssalis]OEU89965.1 asparaginase [Streptomyces abyssalis]
MPYGTPPVLAEVVRSGFVEGQHRGSLVVLAADGSTELSMGEPEAPFFPRSANKPVQAAAMLRAGLDLSGPRLALATASHSGEPFHQDLVRKMLAEHGLTEELLQCPPELPLDQAEAARAVAGAGSEEAARSRVAMNCSGKHSAMLATCAANGWPQETYLEPSHPLQQLVAETLESLSGDPVTHVGTDGCGAPLMAITPAGLARVFRALALAPADSPEGRVAAAMREHPEYVAGTRRIDTWLMSEVSGAVAKVGAESVQGAALADGRALAFKIHDGGNRAVGPVLARTLELLGVDSPVLARIADSPLLGGGQRVGEVRAAF